MAKIDLIDNGWTDLVFELLTMFAIFALIAAIVIAKVSIDNYIASRNAAIETDVELANLAEKKEAKVEKKDEPEPEKIEIEKVKSSVAFTVPEIKKDEEVKEEQEMKSQEELQETNTAIGAFNVEGNDEAAGEVLKVKETIAEPEPPKVEETKVFDVVEEMPQFPGGNSALFEYLSKNIKYPVVAEENGVQGRVVVTFVVERDGSITDVKVVKSVDPSLHCSCYIPSAVKAQLSEMNAFNKIVGLTLILGLFSACGNKPNPEKEQAYQKAASILTADESFFPIIDEELYYFTNQTLDSITPVYINEQDAVKKLMKQETWLTFTTRDFTNNERKSLKDQKFLPRAIPVAYDGLAIIVNNSNPDSCITIKDFARILKGEITKWNEIYPQNKLGVIDVVFDNPLSSTVRWCVDSILGGQQFSAPNIGAVKTSAAVIDYVENHPNSLGIIGSNWLNDKRDTTNVTFKKNISVMGVSKLDSATKYNSWKPYQYYLYNGNYPLRRTIYALLNDTRNGVPTSFAHFVQLPKGQKIILRAGLLPRTANMNVRDVIVNKK